MAYEDFQYALREIGLQLSLYPALGKSPSLIELQEKLEILSTLMYDAHKHPALIKIHFNKIQRIILEIRSILFHSDEKPSEYPNKERIFNLILDLTTRATSLLNSVLKWDAPDILHMSSHGRFG